MSIVKLEDFESFAEYLGLYGLDSDLFYESYYNVQPKDEDEYYMVFDLVENYDC